LLKAMKYRTWCNSIDEPLHSKAGTSLKLAHPKLPSGNSRPVSFGRIDDQRRIDVPPRQAGLGNLAARTEIF
jgi:hypothetical protein